jgi:glycosyltransferase involved in cell wall biosynthesis
MGSIVLSINVSIIIPTLNEARYIEETLKSVASQCPRSDFEVIVCDGGSKDSTVEIARRYSRVVVCPIKDTGTQLDFAASVSRGNILIFLDADTLLPESYLERVVQSFRTDETLWACGAPFGYDGRKRCKIRLGKVTLAVTDYVLVNLAMYLWYVFRDTFRFTEIPGCNFCIRRQIFFDVGGFKRFPSLPVDVALSSAVRELTRQRGMGKMKIFKTMIVLTSPRHITLRRSATIFKNYSKTLIKTRGKLSVHAQLVNVQQHPVK